MSDVAGERRRLESWKEIAAYLQRSERTVRRWEGNEGLPVHRLHHDKRGSVYAYATELDAWRESRRRLLQPDVPVDPPLEGGVWRTRRAWAAVIVAVLSASLGGLWFTQQRKTAAAPTYVPNPEAVRLVERVSFASNAGRVQIQTGIRYLQDAIRIDPAYSPAWSGLATAHIAITWFGEDPAVETMAAAKREAREALRLNPTDSAAWRVLGFATHYLDWDHAAAEAHFRKAIDLTPDDPVVASWFGDFLTDLRRFDEARAYFKRAQDASPRWLEPITFAANTYTIAGNPDFAIPEQLRVLESEPHFGLGIHFLGRSYLVKGDYVHALQRLRKSNEVLGQVPFSMGDLGYALGRAGQRDEARRMLAELTDKRKRGYYPAFPIAQIHLGLGDAGAALAWLERAAEERHLGFYLPSADPIYDAIRSNPSFVKLLERMNIRGQ
jgi:Tfp pilus assembly protein PilF